MLKVLATFFLKYVYSLRKVDEYEYLSVFLPKKKMIFIFNFLFLLCSNGSNLKWGGNLEKKK